jgi:hypothetical protein
MRLLLCLLQILFLMWVSLIEHYWVILRERRRPGGLASLGCATAGLSQMSIM